MSKSGLVGRFGTKRELQLAALEQAAEQCSARSCTNPAAARPPGASAWRRSATSGSRYLGDCPFPGGCFLTTASVEFDAQPGELNDAVRRVMRLWLRTLEREAATAVENGELPAAPTRRTWRSRSTPSRWARTATSSSTATGARCSGARRAMAAVLGG